MRKLLRASVLIMALAIPAFAGNIPNDAVPPPPSEVTQQGEMQNGVEGNIPNDVAGNIPYDVAASSVLVTLLIALIA